MGDVLAPHFIAVLWIRQEDRGPEDCPGRAGHLSDVINIDACLAERPVIIFTLVYPTT